MSREFKEWNQPDQVEKLEPSKEWDELAGENRLLMEALEKSEPVETLGEFRVFPEQTILEGLTLERMERVREVPEIRVSPEEYTTQPFTDTNGIRCYGQVRTEKLSPAALEHISGDPERDIPLWTMQSEDNSCAVNCASFILRSEVDPGLTEDRLILEGRQAGIYDSKGTLFHDVGVLCERHGMEREELANASLVDLEAVHNVGGKVIALVSAFRLTYPEAFGFFRADHAVQVVGIDRNDPENPRVILNDPGRRDGQGLSVPAQVFQKAWKTSGCAAVALYRPHDKTTL